MLRQGVGAGADARHGCPDSARIAAYHEGALRRAERIRLDDHLAGCAQCRMEAIALANARDSTAQDEYAHDGTFGAAVRRRLFSPWLAAAVAGAVAVMVAIGLNAERFQFGAPSAPSIENKLVAPGPSVPLAAQAAAPAAPPLRRLAVQKPPSQLKRSAVASSAPIRRALSESAERLTARAAPAAAANTPIAENVPQWQRPSLAPSIAAPAGTRPAAGTTMAGAGAGTAAIGASASGFAAASAAMPQNLATAQSYPEAAARAAAPAWIITSFASPHGSARWLAGLGGRVERVAPGAPPKILQSGVSQDLIAGSAPNDAVCWIVGRGGVVIRTSDGGKRWMTATAPSDADLVFVDARSASVATVMTVDSRRYITADGGRTWRLK